MLWFVFIVTFWAPVHLDGDVTMTCSNYSKISVTLSPNKYVTNKKIGILKFYSLQH